MRKIVIFLLLNVALFGYSQENYKKIYKFGDYLPNLALVKSITGNYGLINKEGKEVVPTIYKKIYKFGEHTPDLAFVQSITGNYGLINKEGKEEVPVDYDTIEDCLKKLK